MRIFARGPRSNHGFGARKAGTSELIRAIFGRISGRLARFGAVGALGVVVNNMVLLVAHGVGGVPILLASAIAVEVSILNNFVWNERWTFGYKSISIKRLGKFNLTSLGGLVITTTVLYVLVTYFRVQYLIANLVGIGFATAWNFALSMVWTWGMDG